jgi:hypothetical protein
LSFVNYDGRIVCTGMAYSCIYHDVVDSDVFNSPEIMYKDRERLRLDKDLERLKLLVSQFVRFHQTIPLAVVLGNIGTTGVRNIFVELSYHSTSESTMLFTQRPTIDDVYRTAPMSLFFQRNLETFDDRVEMSSSASTTFIPVNFDGTLSTFVGNNIVTKKDKSFMNSNRGFETAINNLTETRLKTVDKQNWNISFEFEGLQPQRIKLIQPIIYVSSLISNVIRVRARIFADSFAEPISVEAEASIEVDKREVAFAELTRDWQSIPDSK